MRANFVLELSKVNVFLSWGGMARELHFGGRILWPKCAQMVVRGTGSQVRCGQVVIKGLGETVAGQGGTVVIPGII